MIVKPKIPGAIIRDPQTRLALPAEGGEVPDNSFWHRRLMAGDVVLVQDAERASAPVAPLTTRKG